MRKVLTLLFLAGILVMSGCIAVQPKRPSPVVKHSKVDPGAIVEKLEKDYGSPVSFKLEYTEIEGKQVCIEKYWYKVSSEAPVYIVVTIENGKICRIHTTER